VKLEGKLALITGGARGIGLATARRFGVEGAKLALWDVSEDTLAAARAELADAGYEVHVATVDVTSAKAVEAALDELEQAAGPVDVVVNNAGITKDAMLHKMTEEAFDAVLAVNLKGVFLVGQAAAKRMRERGHGVILNTASVVAHHGNIGQSNYAATKAAVVNMTRTWARELGPKGVRVNAVAPGFIGTEMVLTVPEKVMAPLKERTPLRRLGQPEEIGAAGGDRRRLRLPGERRRGLHHRPLPPRGWRPHAVGPGDSTPEDTNSPRAAGMPLISGAPAPGAIRALNPPPGVTRAGVFSCTGGPTCWTAFWERSWEAAPRAAPPRCEDRPHSPRVSAWTLR
jgi:3-oxoacyl-[acyl-carrier protein] reductase